MEIFLKYVLPALSFIIVLGIPFVYVLLTGKFSRGIGLVWLLSILWFAILSIPVYDFLWRIDKDLCIETMPEGNSIIAAVMTGWFPGLIVSGLAMLIRKLILKFKPSLLNKTGTEAKPALELDKFQENEK